MSLMMFNFESECLQGNTNVAIILPDKPRTKTPAQFYGSGEKYKVLWLLHGTFGDCTDWIRKSNIELYARERDLIVVMPSALNTNYANWPDFSIGYNMFDFLTDELMPLVYNWFPASDKREDNFIAGNSMGGFGALHTALAYPDQFGKAIGLSSAMVIHQVATMEPGFKNPMADYPYYVETFGEPSKVLESDNNPETLVKKLKAQGKEIPGLYIACGSQDFLLQPNKDFRNFLYNEKVPHIYWEDPGVHDWSFWNKAIIPALDWALEG